jgi:uncharacterized protein (DUF58 family)
LAVPKKKFRRTGRIISTTPPIVPQSQHQTSRFFEPSKLSGLEKMRFTTSRRVEGSYSGRHVAKRRGGAGEFVDYREYSPGDDLRRLGRTGRSYLKLYQDETDLRCTMLLDCSGSMLQGAPQQTHLRKTGLVLSPYIRASRPNYQGSKLEWMQYFATALSHLIIVGRDAVGLCSVKKGIQKYLPAAASVQQLGLLHDAIESLVPEGETQLARGLDELFLQAGRRGVLLVMSDFLVNDFDKVLSSVRKYRSRGWEIIALHLIHPQEEKLPEGNAFRFVGLEQDGEVSCQTHELRKQYTARFEQHVSTVRAGLLGSGCDYHRISTAESYLDVLRTFLVTRSA